MRITIDQIDRASPSYIEGLFSVADSGHRRFRVLPFYHFDTRANLFDFELDHNLEEKSRLLHLKNRENLLRELKGEFGEYQFESKLKNFRDLGIMPMCIIAQHNAFERQARSSFVMGNYYPALTSACALGERILNHLIADLKEYYKSSHHYKKVYKKLSIDNWDYMIEVLADWRVLLTNVKQDFEKLKIIRNKSIHFNV